MLSQRLMSGTVTRRAFLVASAATGAALVSYDVIGANDRVQVAVIGCGRRGTALLANLAQRQDVQVVAACDIGRSRKEAITAAWPQVDIEHAWQDVVARDDVDAVVIAAPDHWHAPMAIAAMQAGKDVYCEPPMALTADDANALRDCASASSRIVQVAARQAFEGQWHTAGRLIREGQLGTVRRCQASYKTNPPSDSTLRGRTMGPDDVDWPAFLGSAPNRSFDPDRVQNWRTYWDYSGGVVTDLHFGALAAVLMATGLDCPLRVSAAGGVYGRNDREAREVPNSFMMTAIYPGDTTVVLTSSPVARPTAPTVVRGERASLFCEGDTLRLVPADQPDASGTRIPVEPVLDAVSDWLDCIRTRRTPVCNAELACKVAVATSMAVEAYRKRKTTHLDTMQQA